MQHPMMKLLGALATAACALGSVWQGVAGLASGTVLVFRRGEENFAVLADNPTLFWFCVVGWFVLAVMFGWLARGYWRSFQEA